MDVMARRRELMGMQKMEELYPIGTDICDYYEFKDTATTYTSINSDTGELYSVSSSSYWTSGNYAEINPNYSYKKLYYRLYRIAFYDKDKTYIGRTDTMNDIGEAVLGNVPSNAKYVRIAMYKPSQANYPRVGLVRTA